MASVFGHAAMAGALGYALPRKLRVPTVIVLGIICATMPDVDVLGFRFGIRYHELWGHRGMTHSLFFGACFGALMALPFLLKKRYQASIAFLLAYFIICTVSHGIVDGMTNGGMGIAYFAPWDEGRYFLPLRQIQVSPLGAANFFSKWGIEVIISEALWIGLPCILFVVIVRIIRRYRRTEADI